MMDIRKFLHKSKKPRLDIDNVDVQENIESNDRTEVGLSSQPESSHHIHKFDIGIFVNKSASESIDSIPGLMEKIWIPPENYKFPSSGPRNLKFQRTWLQKYSWLAYSVKEGGAFCKICVLFSVREGGIGSQVLGQLVLKPFTNWKKALETFNNHQNFEYHQSALLKSTLRADVEKHKVLPIDLQLSKQKLDFIEKSKRFLIPIIDTIILCGKQGLALRGTQDVGKISTVDPLINDGNFRALLRYRAKGDAHLRAHLESSSKNAMYISNRIQNELITICHTLIHNKIVEKVNKSRAFTILGDETSDIAGVEQMSICIRYLHQDEGIYKICEEFLTFTPVEDFTGKGLSKTLLNYLESSGIDLKYFFGQGFDGARSVSGEFHGAQAYIKEKYPLAIYSHCASHSFNLAVNDSCKIAQIRNCLDTIRSVYTFFKYPKRQLALQKAIEADINLKEGQKKKLIKFCATRWVQQHESVATYAHLQPAVIDSLEEISTTWKDSTSSEAFQLLSAIKSLIFQVSLHVLKSVHSLTLSLSRILQTVNQDLAEAIELADAAKNLLTQRRENATEDFNKIFKEVTVVCNEYGIPIQKPRLASRQTHRFNVTTGDVNDYYRISIYIPYIELFITHLEDRFLKHRNILSNFACLFPSKTDKFDEIACIKLFETYGSVLKDTFNEVWVNEVQLWRKRISNLKIQNSLEALDICQFDAFPNVHQILKIMAVLPVTTATNERSFSTLRRLKTYLRSTMKEDRLNGLASLNIHRDIKVDVDSVLSEFFSVPRRVKLLTE